MEITSLSRDYAKVFSANLNASSFASKPPTTTEPTNDGVIDVAKGAGVIPQWLLFLPYGLGSDNDTFSFRVLGWRKIKGSLVSLWVPVTLGEFACTLGSLSGVAGAPVINTELFVDTITPVAASLPDRDIGAGTAVTSDVYISSPANNTAAWVKLRLDGTTKFEFLGDQTLNTPTMNALYVFV